VIEWEGVIIFLWSHQRTCQR